MANELSSRDAEVFTPSFRWAGYTLGFGMGGFFDGILLHQVLQWHHLLSGLEDSRFQDVRVQILADGLFHAVMYMTTVVGLRLLWRARSEFSRPRADRLLIANALIGFGAWHVVDAIVSHWALQIHRVKMDSEIPLFWDIAWFTAFGVLFVLAGLLIRRDHSMRGGNDGRAPAAMALLALAGGAGSAFPPQTPSAVVVVFSPNTAPSQAMAAVSSVEGRLVWTDSSDRVWAIELPDGARTAKLYKYGAIFVSSSVLPISCLKWSRAYG
jgi:uncharacterized membrane protein